MKRILIALLVMMTIFSLEKRASPSALTTMTSRSIISEMQSEEVFW